MIDSHCHLADEASSPATSTPSSAARRPARGRRAVHPRADDEPRRGGRPRCAARGRRCAVCVGVHPHQAGGCGRPDRRRRSGCGRRRSRPCRRGRRRDRARLPLRLLAARRAAGVFARRSAGARARPAGRHPHARGRRRHVRILRRRAGGRCAACSTASPATPRWRAGAGARLHLSFAGIVTFPRRPKRCGRRRATSCRRPAARRDRQPVPGAGAASGPAQRAGFVTRVVETLAEVLGGDAPAALRRDGRSNFGR
jgi:hypothetical protein